MPRSGTSTGEVATWTNQGTSGVSPVVSYATTYPKLATNVSNGRPAVWFDPALGNPYFNWQDAALTALTSTTGVEVMVVAKLATDPPANGSLTGFWCFSPSNTSYMPYTDRTIYESFGATSSFTVSNPSPSLANIFLWNVTSQGGTVTARLNGSQVYSGAKTFSMAGSAWFGGVQNMYLLGNSFAGTTISAAVLKGWMFEIYIWGRPLTTQERSDFIAYVNGQYATTF